MFESVFSSAIVEFGKEAVLALLRGFEPSDFAKVSEQVLNKLLTKYGRYEPIDKARLLLFFQRKKVQQELDAFRESYEFPEVTALEAEFRAEFSADFEPIVLDRLAKDFAQDFRKALISSFQAEIGLILSRIEASEETNNAQHGETHQALIRIEAKFDKFTREVGQKRRSDVEIEQLPRTQIEAAAELGPVLVKSHTPYLRTIEYQERDLQQYKHALEKRVKRRLDAAVDLIRTYNLQQAQAELEALRDEELSDIPNPDEFDPALQASTYRLLGICQMRLGELEAALDNFDIARSIEGETEKLRKALLEYYTTNGEYQVASQLALEMLAAEPTIIEAKNTLAIVQLNEKKFEEVIRFYAGEPQADQDPTAQDILSIAYLQLKDFSAALETAQKLVELEPQAPRAFETLGNVYMARAVAPLEQQLELQEEWFREIVAKESLHQAITNYQKALELYESAGQQAQPRALRMNLANALSIDGRPEDALELISENLKYATEPQVENFLLKAQFEDAAGEHDLAMQTCLEAVEAFPDDYRLMEISAGLHLNKREPEAARQWLDKAEQTCHDLKELTQLKILRAKTYLFQDDRGAAWNCLLDIPPLEKDDVSVLLALGDHFLAWFILSPTG